MYQNGGKECVFQAKVFWVVTLCSTVVG